MGTWLVTGGEGFIGGRIVELAQASSFDLKSGNDILDTEKLSRACAGAEGIFHCAAKISVPESSIEPEAYRRTNVQGTESVIRAAQENGTKIVFSSSAAVYGESSESVRESDSLNPLSPYAQNKRDGEILLRSSGVPSVALRYFNVYGPGQSAAYAGVITAFIRAALQGDDLVIYGDGEQVRDFVYVDDVARANLAAMKADIADGQAINIGSGTRTSINELATEVLRLCESTSRIRHETARPGDIVYSQAEVQVAREKLGWSAQVSLQEGLEQTVGFYKGLMAA